MPIPPPALTLRRVLAALVAGAIAAGLAAGLLTHEQANTLGVLAAYFGLVLTRDDPHHPGGRP